MDKLQIEQFIVGPVQTNCYFAVHTDTKEALIVDPGASGRQLAQRIKDGGYTPVAILLTHGHFDHADGIADLQKALEHPIPVYAHEDEKETLEEARLNLSFSLDWNARGYAADVYVKDNEELSLAGFSIKVLHTPGHTVGGCCYYFPEENVVFSGDSLFCGSIGRTDFPQGSMSDLVRSVRDKILTLPEDTQVLPGHDAATTVGQEKIYNPFLV